MLGAVVDAFSDAHDLDETIPHLVPISTRRLLGSHHAASDAAAGSVPQAAPPAAS